jgi:DNA-binding NarL/FixJ family response regulator
MRIKEHVTLVGQCGPPGARILVVDDNASVRHSLRVLLESNHNWRVCDEASDGHEAIAKFDEKLFDLVVLDFQMPGISGFDAAKQMTQRFPNARILMVTLHYSAQLVQEAQRIGIKGICAKTDSKSVIEGAAAILDDGFYFSNSAPAE